MTGNTVIDALLDTASRLKEDYIDKSLFGKADFDKYKVLLVTARTGAKIGARAWTKSPRPASDSSIHSRCAGALSQSTKTRSAANLWRPFLKVMTV